MASKAIKEEISQMHLLHDITVAFSELAFRKIQSIRDDVISERNYMNLLEEVFLIARKEYQFIYKRKSKNSKKGLTFLAHNGKKAAVLFSANQGLFGAITSQVFDKFSEFVTGTEYEIAIVGSVGVSMFKSRFPNRPFTKFELPDLNAPGALLGPMVNHLAAYDEINIFHGMFVSALRQDAGKYTISSTLPEQQAEIKLGERFYFEPSLEDVLRFFESEMFYSQLLSVSWQSMLAKLGSRAVSMDQASQRILKETEKKSIVFRKLSKRDHEKKQGSLLVAANLF
jgi:ATP synthase F1 gamma subunit